jgi:membrane protease YdiL (CAAX protease family)
VTTKRIRAVSPAGRLITLATGVVVTGLAIVLPHFDAPANAIRSVVSGIIAIDMRTARTLVLLALGLALTLPMRRRSGLRLGRFRQNRWRVLLVCGLPVLLTAIVYPLLPEHPFADAGIDMWLLSPLAQDLIFMGFLFGRLERSFPPRHPDAFRVSSALAAGAIFFAAWHVQNFFADVSAAYVVFQLAYTAAGFLLTGLSRQWTGSLLYATLSHSAVNLIAWLAR